MRSDAFPALGSYTPRSALVIVRSPALFSQKVLLDQGTGAGIQVGDPVRLRRGDPTTRAPRWWDGSLRCRRAPPR